MAPIVKSRFKSDARREKGGERVGDTPILLMHPSKATHSFFAIGQKVPFVYPRTTLTTLWSSHYTNESFPNYLDSEYTLHSSLLYQPLIFAIQIFASNLLPRWRNLWKGNIYAKKKEFSSRKLIQKQDREKLFKTFKKKIRIFNFCKTIFFSFEILV